MSLLFENAVGAFDPATATLHQASDGDLRERAEPALALTVVVEYATHHESLAHPEAGWTCLPLHDPDSATLTGEFVAYTDHQIHGEVIVFETPDGRDALPVEAFAHTDLARQLRFWHSDHVPPERPDYYDSPIDSPEPPRNPVDANELFAGLRGFVDQEQDAERDANRERARRGSPRDLYERGGDAVPALRGHGDTRDGRYRFSIHDPDDEWDGPALRGEFGIHEGNEVLLHPPSEEQSPDAFPMRATVDESRGSTAFLTVDWDTVDDQSAVGSFLRRERVGYGLTLLSNPVPYDRERAALADLRDSPLGEVLAGERPLTFGNPAAPESDPKDDVLNQEQEVAVEHALLADDLFCIHGPPGTGKTRTLVEVVRRAVEAGESVLVCADSNQAVDNIVAGTSDADTPDERSLHAYGQHGSEEFTLDRYNVRRSDSEFVRDHYRDVAGADVVAATNSSAAGLTRTFDLVIVDEATQSTFVSTCIPLSKARRAVLAGDHRQLPPYSATESPPDSAYGMSLFEHLYAEGGVYADVGVQLRTQYRMHRNIAYFPNRQFYDRELRNGRSIDPLETMPPLVGYDIGGSEETVSHSTKNPTEASLIAHVVTDLTDELDPTEVGVIAPYTAQVRAIERALRDRDSSGVTVDTIDAFQGSERSAIVISLTRSNGDGDIGFLGRPADGPRRLNVALTRAQQCCVVVGDWYTLGSEGDGETCHDLYRDLRNHLDDTGRLRKVDPALL